MVSSSTLFYCAPHNLYNRWWPILLLITVHPKNHGDGSGFVIPYRCWIPIDFTHIHYCDVIMGAMGVSNHQPHDCLLNRSFRRKSRKISKLCVTGLCAGNSPVTGEIPAQMASNAENVSIWWRHHVLKLKDTPLTGTDVWTYHMITTMPVKQSWEIRCCHELWPTPVSRPFPCLDSTLGLAGIKHCKKIIRCVPTFRLALQILLHRLLLFCAILLFLLTSSLGCYWNIWLCFSPGELSKP